MSYSLKERPYKDWSVYDLIFKDYSVKEYFL